MAARVHLELQNTAPLARLGRRANQIVGTWLSLVERTLGVGEVASSNLVVPTIFLSITYFGSIAMAFGAPPSVIVCRVLPVELNSERLLLPLPTHTLPGASM